MSSLDIPFDAEDATSVVEPIKATPSSTSSGKKRTTPRKKRATRKSLKSVPKKAGKTGGVKKPHRWRPGTVALREIRKYQKGTELQFQKAPFKRLVRELTQDTQYGLGGDVISRFEAEAFEVLQEGAEAFLVQLFEKTNRITVSEKMQTILPRHQRLVREVQMQGLPPL